MILIYRRFGEYITFEIDRKNKKFSFKGEQTNYKTTPMPWRMLWDKCEHHKKNLRESNVNCFQCIEVVNTQDKTTENLIDDDFIKVFSDQMKVYGFDLKTREV